MYEKYVAADEGSEQYSRTLSMASATPGNSEKFTTQKTLFGQITNVVKAIFEELFEKWNTIPYAIR